MQGYLMSAATAICLFGWYVIYTNKEMSSKPHLTSLHGKLGVFVLVSYLGVGIFGGVALHPDFGIMKHNKQVSVIAGIYTFIRTHMNHTDEYVYALQFLRTYGIL